MNAHYSLTDERKELEVKIAETRDDLRRIQSESVGKYQRVLDDHTQHSRRFGRDVSEEREQLTKRLTQIVCDKYQEKDRRRELRDDQVRMHDRMLSDEEQRRSRLYAYRKEKASKK